MSYEAQEALNFCPDSTISCPQYKNRLILINLRAEMRLLAHRPRMLLDTEPTSPPGNRTRSGGYSTEANFDTNMVIILAALLCALICALGLNSIVRCALRCSRRFTFDAPDEAAAAARGLRRNALRQIPVAVYGSTGVKMIATDCPICLGEFNDGEKVRVLPNCNHGFHVRCIDTWLVSHSTCPSCRQSLIEQPGNSGSWEVSSGGRRPGNGGGGSGDAGGGGGEIG